MGGVVVEEAGGGVEFGGGADEEGPVKAVDFVGAVFVDVEGDVEEGGGDWWWGSLGDMGFGWHFGLLMCGVLDVFLGGLRLGGIFGGTGRGIMWLVVLEAMGV